MKRNLYCEELAMSITNRIRLVSAVLGVAGLTLLSIVALRDLQGASDAAEANPVKEAASKPVLGYGLVDTEGGIRRLAPSLPGRVKEIPVRENDEVQAGTLLLRVEDERARLRLRQAQIELDDAKIRLEDARQEPQRHHTRLEQQERAVKVAKQKLSSARRKLAWLCSMKDKELGTDRDVKDQEDLLQMLGETVAIEQARLEELKLQDPMLPEARARMLVEARQSQLELAENEQRQCELWAPTKGKVLRILVGEGDFVVGAAGPPALEFCPDRPRIVRAEMSQEWAQRLAPGQKVLLQDDEVPELQWEGEVRRVSDWLTSRRCVLPGPQELHDQRTAECIIEPKYSPQSLRIGQKLRVLLGSGSW
jgi:multidrug resistance efflux pump